LSLHSAPDNSKADPLISKKWRDADNLLDLDITLKNASFALYKMDGLNNSEHPRTFVTPFSPLLDHAFGTSSWRMVLLEVGQIYH
jgi:hypothetical protein